MSTIYVACPCGYTLHEITEPHGASYAISWRDPHEGERVSACPSCGADLYPALIAGQLRETTTHPDEARA